MARRRSAGPTVTVAALVLGAALCATPAAATDPALGDADLTAVGAPTPTPTVSAPTPTPTVGGAERTAGATPSAEASRAAERTAGDDQADGPAAEHGTGEPAADPHDSAALAAAIAALADAEADVREARAELAKARAAVIASERADAAAQSDLDAAVLAEERAARELVDVEARIEARLTDLGSLARTAYQSGGAMGEWALVLASTTPNQLTERLAFLQSVGSAGNAVVAELAEDRSDLVAAQERLAAAREVAQEKRSAAARALAAVRVTAMLAKAAEREVSAVLDLREAAVQAARDAAAVDRRQYQVMVTQSGSLGARIVELSRELARGGRRPRADADFARPGTGPMTSEYGPRYHPILHYVKVHTGVDFGAGNGIVYAANDGVVLLTEYNVAYGHMTVVDHGRIGRQRLTTLYAHQSTIGVEPGQRVVKGQAIGVIGSTGYSTGPHLHVEVRVDGVPIDPTPFVADAPLPASLRSRLMR